ncbi:MAG: secondary thiamine-phosphate synthase enzyme YjbQ [Candidatus Aenigmatarchaeota archaeon]
MAKVLKFSIRTKGKTDIVDITDMVAAAVAKSEAKNGCAVVFVPGSTAAVTTMEYEAGLKKDIPNALEKIAPTNADWDHHKAWNDKNGAAHIKSSLIGPSLAIPFENGKLLLGTWQQIVLIDFDNEPRTRDLIVAIIF